MSYEGQAVKVLPLDGGFVELRFDLQGDSVNKFNALTLGELKEAVEDLRARKDLRGRPDHERQGRLLRRRRRHRVPRPLPEERGGARRAGSSTTDAVFSAIEDLDAPSVVAINGVALGGGFELCLAASYRAMSTEAKVGLPETKLGIFPGWGGTVRLSRLCGADTAIEWIAGGEQWSAADALKVGAVDAVVAPADLREAALGMLKDAADGKLDWKARREEKKAPLKLERDRGRDGLRRRRRPSWPARPARTTPPRSPPSRRWRRARARPATRRSRSRRRPSRRSRRRPTAHSLVSVFLGDQAVKKIAKKHAKAARPVKRAAVLGAGIMGGGISYQSASKGVPVLMKDIAAEGARAGHGRGGEAPREAGRARQAHDRRRWRRSLAAHHADALLRRLRRGRLRRRGGGRERDGQEEGPGRGRGPAAGERDPRLEHLDDLDHAARRRP